MKKLFINFLLCNQVFIAAHLFAAADERYEKTKERDRLPPITNRIREMAKIANQKVAGGASVGEQLVAALPDFKVEDNPAAPPAPPAPPPPLSSQPPLRAHNLPVPNSDLPVLPPNRRVSNTPASLPGGQSSGGRVSALSSMYQPSRNENPPSRGASIKRTRGPSQVPQAPPFAPPLQFQQVPQAPPFAPSLQFQQVPQAPPFAPPLRFQQVPQAPPLVPPLQLQQVPQAPPLVPPLQLQQVPQAPPLVPPLQFQQVPQAPASQRVPSVHFSSHVDEIPIRTSDAFSSQAKRPAPPVSRKSTREGSQISIASGYSGSGVVERLSMYFEEDSESDSLFIGGSKPKAESGPSGGVQVMMSPNQGKLRRRSSRYYISVNIPLHTEEGEIISMSERDAAQHRRRQVLQDVAQWDREEWVDFASPLRVYSSELFPRYTLEKDHFLWMKEQKMPLAYYGLPEKLLHHVFKASQKKYPDFSADQRAVLRTIGMDKVRLVFGCIPSLVAHYIFSLTGSLYVGIDEKVSDYCQLKMLLGRSGAKERICRDLSRTLNLSSIKDVKAHSDVYMKLFHSINIDAVGSQWTDAISQEKYAFVQLVNQCMDAKEEDLMAQICRIGLVTKQDLEGLLRSIKKSLAQS